MGETRRLDHGTRIRASDPLTTSARRLTSRRWQQPTLAVVAFLWLILLLGPLAEAWQQRSTPRGQAALASTTLFTVLYVAMVVRYRSEERLLQKAPLREAVPFMFGLVALGAITFACIGAVGLACAVYIAIAGVLLFPPSVSTPIVLSLIAATLAFGKYGDGRVVSIVFAIMTSALVVRGVRQTMQSNRELLAAQQENARLAVDNERSRFARDLHDILGHSLTVITIKTELARKLLDVDVDRARAELVDLERLSRDAMADVRRAVQGYREITLPGELVRARTALRTAEIEAELPSSADDVPSDLRELFAWTVREGVTNVIKHSGATRCEVRLSGSSAEVIDNGPGEPLATSDGHGSGLAGLHERAAAAGATVVTRDLSPGFSLRVVRA